MRAAKCRDTWTRGQACGYRGRLTQNTWEPYYYCKYGRGLNMNHRAPRFTKMYAERTGYNWDGVDGGSDFWLFIPPGADAEGTQYLVKPIGGPIREVEDRLMSLDANSRVTTHDAASFLRATATPTGTGVALIGYGNGTRNLAFLSMYTKTGSSAAAAYTFTSTSDLVAYQIDNLSAGPTFNDASQHQLAVNIGPIGVSGSVTMTQQGARLNRATGKYNGAVTETNTSGAPLVAPLWLKLNGPTRGVSVDNAGGQRGGAQYVIVSGTLGAGASDAMPLTLTNPSRSLVSYTTALVKPSIRGLTP